MNVPAMNTDAVLQEEQAFWAKVRPNQKLDVALIARKPCSMCQEIEDVRESEKITVKQENERKLVGVCERGKFGYG